MSPKPIKIKITGDDHASGVLGSLGKRADRFGDSMKGLGGVMGKIGLGGLGLSIGAALTAGISQVPGHLMQVEEALSMLGFAGNYTAEQTERVGKAVRRMSGNFIQSEVDLLRGIDKLDDAGFNLDQSLGIVLPMAAKQATAFGTSLDVTTGIAYTLGSQFKLLPDQMEGAIDMVSELARANFDISELSGSVLPRLGQATAALNLNGREGLAELAGDLELVRSKMRDSGAAAKGYSKLVEGILDPEVMKRFQDWAGVNVLAEMQGAAKRGESQLTAYLELVKRVTDTGDEKSRTVRLNTLFGREDVAAVRALLDQFDLRGEVQRKYRDSSGVTQKGFELHEDTTAGQLEKLKLSMLSLDFKPITQGLSLVNTGLHWMNEEGENAQFVVDRVAQAIGGPALLALVRWEDSVRGIGAAFNVLSESLPAVRTGLSTAFAPFRALEGALGLYRHFTKDQSEEEPTSGEVRRPRGMKVDGGDLPIPKSFYAESLRGYEFNPGKAMSLSNPEAIRTAAGAGGPARVEGEMVIRLENFPAGTKVATKSNGVEMTPEIGRTW